MHLSSQRRPASSGAPAALSTLVVLLLLVGGMGVGRSAAAASAAGQAPGRAFQRAPGPCGGDDCTLPDDPGACDDPEDPTCDTVPAGGGTTQAPSPTAPGAVATTAPTGVPAPSDQSPATQPQAAASTILTAPGGFQPGEAAPGFEPATHSGSDTPGWMLPVVLVAVVGAPFIWLARRHRVPSDVEP